MNPLGGDLLDPGLGLVGDLQGLDKVRETGQSQGKSLKTFGKLDFYTSRRSQGKVGEKSSKLPHPRSAATVFDA